MLLNQRVRLCINLLFNIPYHYSDDNLTISKVMKIKLIKRFKEDEFTFPFLKQYGVNAIRGPRSMPKELSKIISTKKSV